MTKNHGIAAIIRALIVAYMVTGFMLLILAFAMFKLGLQEHTVDFGVTFIYILATGVAGLIVGKSMKEKKFLWGCLVGFLYVMIIFLGSIMMSGGMDVVLTNGFSSLLLCIGGGMLGGMLS